jgi:hypothetical protein
MSKSSYQGGFSDEVANSYRFKDYVEGYAELSRETGKRHKPGGYIGDPDRTPERDKMLEGYLRRQGLGSNGIADWLASTNGRHLMDDVEDDTSESKFRKLCRNCTEHAFLDVMKWNHPDGRKMGSREMLERMQEAVATRLAQMEKSLGNAA